MSVQAVMRGVHPQDLANLFFNEHSVQSDDHPAWEEGRRIDMDAFDQLPRQVRDWINERDAFYAIEDVLYEHVNVHRGDWELTLVWLLEGEDIQREIDALHVIH